METIEIAKINQYPDNPKEHPDEQVDMIINSIREFGFNQPIVIDKNNEIIVGHGRYLAALKMGMQEVPIIRKENLTEEQVKAYRLADNKLNESGWNIPLVIEELKGLSDEMISLTGFDKSILGLEEDEFDAEAEYGKIVEPVSKLGDLYQLGDHRLMCGDSTKEEDVEKLMDGKLGNLIFTDPPYNVDYDYNVIYGIAEKIDGRERKKKFARSTQKIFNDKMSNEECMKFYTAVLKNLHKFTENNTCIYWWYASKNDFLNRKSFRDAGWNISQDLIWVKNGPVFSKGQDYHGMYEPCMFGWKKGETHFTNKKYAKYKDAFNLDDLNFDEFLNLLNVWFQKRDNTSSYEHPTQKPVRLTERALKKNSKDGDIVVDFFGGSGSTLIGCEQARRKCYMMELDPKYCDVIVKRWERFTEKKAEKITNND